MGALTAAQRASARFFKSEARGSVLLLLSTVTALVWANSPWSGSYFHLLETKIGVTWNDWKFALSWSHWLNDGLMALFFFVVGLEIKREILAGELSTIKKAILPVAAAVGGMLAPAVIYVALNRDSAHIRGWGIPMATDIAFALGILTLLGPRVPAPLKVFLTALAIADDLGAVMVIAVFYTEQISIGPCWPQVSVSRCWRSRHGEESTRSQCTASSLLRFGLACSRRGFTRLWRGSWSRWSYLCERT